jgi:nonsense-mediated mRNA decay protein 3
VFKLKKLEDEGVMIEEGETVAKRKKKKEEKENKDYEDFLDDIEADKDLQKGIKLYKNEDRLKQMSKEQLDKEIEDMELVDLMEDMNLEGEAAQELPVGEEAQGIDDLIARMDKVTIDKE